jgi:phage terminase small subunit
VPDRSTNRKLTPNQWRFVQEYIVDLDAGAAAIRAGYSAKSAGWLGYQLLQKPLVQQAVRDEKLARSARTGITQDRVVQELAILGFADLTDYVEWDKASVVLKDSKTLDAAKRRAVIEVSQTATGIKIKLADKKGALDSLGRHTNAFDADNRSKTDALATLLHAIAGSGGSGLKPIADDPEYGGE